jgi:glycosyltransferase involved in cell wall biosynthesis
MNTESPRILYVGRVSPEKGVHILLDAFRLIAQKFSNATLTIVGPEWIAPRDHIVNLSLDRELAASLDKFYEGGYQHRLLGGMNRYLAEHVRFVGPVSHDDIANYYAASDVYVNASFYESFGMSIIEAMAAGVPVVATDVGAVPELIRDRITGLLVKPNNAVEMAEAVCSLLMNSNFRKTIASTARDSVLHNFSWETISATLWNLYGSLTLPPSFSRSSVYRTNEA